MMSLLKLRYIAKCVMIVAILFSARILQAADWPQWRGIASAGKWTEEDVLDHFPDEGPHVVWRTPIGAGYAGPAVADGRVFVMDRQRTKGEDGTDLPPQEGAILGHERLVCLAAQSGQVLWDKSFESNYKIAFPSGPRGTPTVVEGDVYILGAMGDLRCYAVETGELQWAKNFPTDFGAPVPVWGWATHPVVAGELVICTVGGPETAVVAFDKRSGEERWRALTAEEVGYSTPRIIRRDDTDQLIVWLDTALYGLDVESGALLWSQPHPRNGAPQRPIVHIMSPEWSAPWLLVSEHYQGSTMLRFDETATKPEIAWRSDPEKRPNLNVVMAPPFIDGELVFGITNNGLLRCLKASTGEVLWETIEPTGKRKQANATAFMVRHGDHSYLFNDQGDLIVSQMSAQGYRELDRTHLIQPLSYGRGRDVVWSHPAFANRCIIVRNDAEIACFSLEKTPADDLTRMQGTWRAVAGMRDGDSIPARQLKKMSRTVRGSRYEVSVESDELAQSFPGEFTLDPNATPKQIDAILSSGGAQGKRLLGIYEFRGSDLAICFAPLDQDRPATMLPSAGSQQTLTVWGRTNTQLSSTEVPANHHVDPVAVARIRSFCDAVQNCRVLHFRGSVSSATLPTSGPQPQSELDLLVTRDGRIRCDIQRVSPSPRSITIRGDGKRTIAYRSNATTYTEMPAMSDWESVRDMEALPGHQETGAMLQNIVDSDPFTLLMETVTDCRIVKRDQKGERDVDHIHCEQPDLVWDIWLTLDEKPSAVQFQTKQIGALNTQVTTETYHDWQFDPQVDDNQFLIQLPDGMRRVES